MRKKKLKNQPNKKTKQQNTVPIGTFADIYPTIYENCREKKKGINMTSV